MKAENKSIEFSELEKTMNETLNRDEWETHENGGGWKQKTATVEASAYLEKGAVVYGDARVYGNAVVSGNAVVYGDARVNGDAWVYGNARVSGKAWVSGDAVVSGNARDGSPLQIQGSMHHATNSAYGEITIGCKSATFAWWKSEEALDFAKRNGYSKKQIKEYAAIIDLIIAVGK